MKKFATALLLVISHPIFTQEVPITPPPHIINELRGTYRVQAVQNAAATAEQKEAVNIELHKIGVEAMQKLQFLMLKYRDILNMQGKDPIMQLHCQWANVEIPVSIHPAMPAPSPAQPAVPAQESPAPTSQE